MRSITSSDERPQSGDPGLPETISGRAKRASLGGRCLRRPRSFVSLEGGEEETRMPGESFMAERVHPEPPLPERLTSRLSSRRGQFPGESVNELIGERPRSGETNLAASGSETLHPLGDSPPMKRIPEVFEHGAVERGGSGMPGEEGGEILCHLRVG